jgi:methylenetetrahydrofolate dehydrogenase (NADP+)/methenyltetrahydrofolate cyclohydrolase
VVVAPICTLHYHYLFKQGLLNNMIIDGKAIADQIQEDISKKVKELKGRKPCLAVLIIGDHEASKIYVNRKVQACDKVGIKSIVKKFEAHTSEAVILHEISVLNEDSGVDGILVQLPLPAHIRPQNITRAVKPEKDIDGFHPINVGKLLIGETDGFCPCTPLGIKVLMEKSGIEGVGKHALVIGRSNIVGKPMAALMMQNTPFGNATVTIANSHTRDLKNLCRGADIIIAAAGQPKFIGADMVKEGAVVIDVGINKVSSAESPSGYKIVGDVDFENVKDKCSFITPVPKGVGPMTIAMLLSNTFLSYQRRMHTCHTI